MPYPSCATSEPGKAPMNGLDIHHVAMMPGQAFYMNYGFIQSKMKENQDGGEEYTGIVSSQGFNSYVLIKDQCL